MERYLPFISRILMAFIFVMSGFNKIMNYKGTAGYMESFGVPDILLPLVILVELAGGLALVAGWKTRIAAWLLAGFTVLSTLIFHTQFGDQTQMIMFMKNLAITGGLLYVATYGAGGISLDRKFGDS